jgi:hypothetical protein
MLSIDFLVGAKEERRSLASQYIFIEEIRFNECQDGSDVCLVLTC